MIPVESALLAARTAIPAQILSGSSHNTVSDAALLSMSVPSIAFVRHAGLLEKGRHTGNLYTFTGEYKGGMQMDIRKIEPRRESCYLCGAPLPKGRRKYCHKCRPSRARGSPVNPHHPGHAKVQE